jgi:hypothetical protein
VVKVFCGGVRQGVKVALARLLMVCVAVLAFAGNLFAQTAGDPGTFDTFPEFFDLSTLVTGAITFLASAGVVIIAAVVAWRLTMKLVNMAIRRIG